MASNKKITYSEPKGYFNSAMKAAYEAAKRKKSAGTTSKKPTSKKK